MGATKRGAIHRRFQTVSSHTHAATLLQTNKRRRVTVLTDAPISFGQIPREHWYQPDWVDEEKARNGRLKMMAQGIIYAGAWHQSLMFSKGESNLNFLFI